MSLDYEAGQLGRQCLEVNYERRGYYEMISGLDK